MSQVRVEYEDDEDEGEGEGNGIRNVDSRAMVTITEAWICPTYSSDAQYPGKGNGWLLPPKHLPPIGHGSH